MYTKPSLKCRPADTNAPQKKNIYVYAVDDSHIHNGTVKKVAYCMRNLSEIIK